MDDTAVLDAPVDTGLDAGLDTDLGTPDVQENTDPNAIQEDPDAAAVRAAQKPLKIFAEKNKFSPEVRAHLDELKKTNPALASAIRQLAFDHAKFADNLPGGLKEVETLRQQIEELGGETGIQELQQELGYFSKIDELYTKGDPGFIDALIEGDKNAFLRLAPNAFAKYAELDGEGYTSYICRETVAHANANDIPLFLMRLGDQIPKDNPAAVEAFNRISQWFGFLKENAAKPIKTPASSVPSDEREATLKQREDNLRNQEWNGTVVSERQKLFDAEFKHLTAGRTVSDQLRAGIHTLFNANLSEAIAGDAKYAKDLAVFKANGDKEGYLRTARNAFQKFMPEALKRAINIVLRGEKPGPRPGSNGNVQRPGQPPPNLPAGATFVSAKPKNIDYSDRRNNQDLILSKKAYTTDGKLVYWQ